MTYFVPLDIFPLDPDDFDHLLPSFSSYFSDPLRIVKSEVELFALREAEIKHARLAMLGSLGWPVSEVLQAP